MPGKWTYLLGFLSSDHAADLLIYGAAYAKAKRRRAAVAPPGLAAHVVIGRFPAMEQAGDAECGKLPIRTIVTGFLGAGKTTLVRHVLANANGRRIAVIVNEFGALGIDGETLRSCGITGCSEENIVELTNGCLCCTVAEDFVPTMQALIDRPTRPSTS